MTCSQQACMSQGLSQGGENAPCQCLVHTSSPLFSRPMSAAAKASVAPYRHECLSLPLQGQVLVFFRMACYSLQNAGFQRRLSG